jgi:hypothetical protein
MLTDGTCPPCQGYVEDEFHFVIVCHELSDIRDRFLADLEEVVLGRS